MSDSKYPIHAVTFHLEDGMPGYFGISLTPDDRIDHMSIFVKSELCKHGHDPACPEVTARVEDWD
jgi:hypothetical protein